MSNALNALAQLAAALPVPAAYNPATIPQSFAAAIKAGNFQRTDSYLFGSNATTTDPKQIRIADLPTLAKYFKPYKPGTGLYTINYEIERYQPFNASNHVIGANGLALTATLPTQPWPVLSKSLTQAPNGSNQLYLNDVSGINLGQVAACANFGGLLFVTAVDTVNNIVTLWGSNPATGAAPVINNLNPAYTTVDFLPIYVATISSVNSAGSLTLTCLPTAAGGTAPWLFPPQIVPGMQVTAYGSSAFGQPIIQSVNASSGVISLASPIGIAYSVGMRVLCMPPLNAGQIWSHKNYWAGANALQKSVAVEVEAIMPRAQGCWPAAWLYGDGSVVRPALTGSEIDIMEMYCASFSPKLPGVLTQTTHSPSGAAQVHSVATGNGSWLTASYWRPPVSVIDGNPHRFQMIWNGSAVYYFVDDAFVCADLGMATWTGQPATIGCNLAVGSVQGSSMQIGVYPAHTPTSGVIDSFTIQQINVWVL